MLLVTFLLFYLHPLVNGDSCGSNCERSKRPKRVFSIYWNVPTFMCHQYGMNFDEVTDFNIKHNSKDNFRGETISIYYDPGKFPALMPLKNGKYEERNGGVPQRGNITIHLQQFNEDLDKMTPDKNFGGIGVIDFERWKPIFRQNWGNTEIHKKYSIELVRKEHPKWSESMIEAEATKKFEKYARYFMEETLKLAKKTRKRAKWGYYGFPYCYNVTPNNPGPDCDAKATIENDRLSWMYNNQEILFPSVYVRHEQKPEERVYLVQGRIKEAVRISNNLEHSPSVLAYWWYVYQDKMDIYLSETDVEKTFQEIVTNGGDGIIIWGSSSDVNSLSKCKRLREYLLNTLGPFAVNVTETVNGRSSLNF
ncbi:PREDICTED: hyaluronidase [Polistes canadensis]|uniref:hyaluronidase n=1 Tax=Polistes canadensis TaxID=91411 RepID=UPI000718FB66|nr:PREDICTED: hyaluronidase [Polistes canadensis]